VLNPKDVSLKHQSQFTSLCCTTYHKTWINTRNNTFIGTHKQQLLLYSENAVWCFSRNCGKGTTNAGERSYGNTL